MAKVTIPHPGWRQFAGRRPIAAGGGASLKAARPSIRWQRSFPAPTGAMNGSTRPLIQAKDGRPLLRVTRLEDASGPAPWRRRLGLLEGRCSVFHPVPGEATMHLIVDLVDLRLEAGLVKTLAVWAYGTVAFSWAMGSGCSTLAPGLAPDDRGEGGGPQVDRGEPEPDRGDLPADRGELDPDRGELIDSGLRQAITSLGARPRKEKLRQVISQLCPGHWRTSAWLANQLNLDPGNLADRHLVPW